MMLITRHLSNDVPMDMGELVRLTQPSNTILLLGAGASIESGAPSGAALAHYLASKIAPPPAGNDLSEISGIFQNKLGRTRLAEAIADRLKTLKPTGGLLALPAFDWRAIYTTNFDRLVEDSYHLAGRPLRVCRSNYDFSRPSGSETSLYKIHGCITQDVGFGSKARMVLTELDYDEVSDYRQALFSSLQLGMMTANTLIVGQSLTDAHLRDLAKKVSGLRQQGIQGRVFLLAFDYDRDRAALFEQRGIEVVQGTLSTLLYELNATPAVRTAVTPQPLLEEGRLPTTLATTTVDVSHAVQLTSDAVRLFNGGPATYADIEQGLTIERAQEHRLASLQNGLRGYFLVLAGAGGVGKTSLARRLLHRRHHENFAAWEHSNSFPLDADAWILVESGLRQAGRQGVLLIDDCAQHLAAVNKLVDALGQLDRPFLRVVVTVNASQWKTRTKSRFFFSRGTLERLSLLADSDIRSMVNLVDRNQAIRALVEADFLLLGYQDKLRRLRDRCSADMFVCLKNIFRNESLDQILLQEYADLEESARDIYRYVAAIQAMGGKVHRQLIMRLLSIEAGGLQALLGHMEGVVDEYDISARLGLFGWTTRHDVIAKIIATYKFADQSELYNLLERLIDGLNPTVAIELQTATAICSEEMGINRLSDLNQQVRLLEKVIAVVPGERTPRRRLVRLHLNHGHFGEAEAAISASQRDIGSDDIVDRYRALLALRRSEQLEGLRDEDRLAMLLEAERLALRCVARQSLDRYNYRALADVGMSLASRFEDLRIVDATIAAMKLVEGDVADPDFARDRRDLEAFRVRQSPPVPSAS